jgi:hypothetical protein
MRKPLWTVFHACAAILLLPAAALTQARMGRLS